MKVNVLIICVGILFGGAFTANAQSPYQLNWKKEFMYYGSGLTTIGLGAYQRSKTPLYTTNDLENLDASFINSLDQPAVDQFSLAAHHASDYFWYGSFSAPLWSLVGQKSRKHFGQVAALWGEVVFINSGLTLLTKYTVRRTRPFVYNQDAPLTKKLTPNAKGSFFSGHTSMTAANTFFAAKVFADFYPDSPWKPVVWGLGASIPAITGYLRVKGGRHFPTDVITGYIVGAAVGILVPHWHKKPKLNDKGLKLDLGYNAARLKWVF